MFYIQATATAANTRLIAKASIFALMGALQSHVKRTDAWSFMCEEQNWDNFAMQRSCLVDTETKKRNKS